MDRDSARQILETRGIPFSESSFIEYVKNNEYNIVRIYLDAGIRPDVLDDNGNSALLIAAQCQNLETFNVLLEYGAKIEQLINVLHQAKLPTKDIWDKLSSLSSIATVISSLLIAGIGWHFTNTYNSRQIDSQTLQAQEQNRVKELEVVSEMLPYLTSSKEEEKKVALTVQVQLTEEFW